MTKYRRVVQEVCAANISIYKNKILSGRATKLFSFLFYMYIHCIAKRRNANDPAV